MKQKIMIERSEGACGSGDTAFVARGLDDDVAVCIYDEEHGIGAMVRAALPDERRCALDNAAPYTYAREGVQKAIAEMEKLGADISDMHAFLIGGALGKLCRKNGWDVGKRTLERAKKELIKRGIHISGQYTGGSRRRSVEFDLNTGGLHLVLL